MITIIFLLSHAYHQTYYSQTLNSIIRTYVNERSVETRYYYTHIAWK